MEVDEYIEIETDDLGEIIDIDNLDTAPDNKIKTSKIYNTDNNSSSIASNTSNFPRLNMQHKAKKYHYEPLYVSSDSLNFCKNAVNDAAVIIDGMNKTDWLFNNKHKVQQLFGCYLCPFYDRLEKNIVTHWIQTHSNSKPYVCSVCAEKFDTNSKLEKHINLAHSTSPVYSFFPSKYFQNALSCKVLNLDNQNNWWEDFYGNFQCKDCSFKSSNIDEFQQHHLQSHTVTKLNANKKEEAVENPFKLPILIKNIPWHEVIKTYRYIPSLKFSYGCLICSNKYTSHIEVVRHVYAFHRWPTSVQCPVCKVYIDLNNHLGRLSSFTCENCFQLLTIFEKFYFGITSYTCSICRYSCSYRLQMSRHLVCVHQTLVNKMHCRFCSLTYRSVKELITHLLTQHIIEMSKFNNCRGKLEFLLVKELFGLLVYVNTESMKNILYKNYLETLRLFQYKSEVVNANQSIKPKINKELVLDSDKLVNVEDVPMTSSNTLMSIIDASKIKENSSKMTFHIYYCPYCKYKDINLKKVQEHKETEHANAIDKSKVVNSPEEEHNINGMVVDSPEEEHNINDKFVNDIEVEPNTKDDILPEINTVIDHTINNTINIYVVDKKLSLQTRVILERLDPSLYS